jgi:nitroreductase
MKLVDAIRQRRSIRKFTEMKIPESIMREALMMATLAPNSSNMQMWDFYWVRDNNKKSKLVEFCLNQSAARTAQELVVITVNPKKWKRSLPLLQNYVEAVNAPKQVKFYYHKLIPFTYRWGVLNSWALIKFIITFVTGLIRPIPRGPYTRGNIETVLIKSAALACQNFVLTLTSHGFQTCMMEGFDEVRVKKLLGLTFYDRIVMVIACGQEVAGKGTWGEQFRIPEELVIHEV